MCWYFPFWNDILCVNQKRIILKLKAFKKIILIPNWERKFWVCFENRAKVPIKGKITGKLRKCFFPKTLNLSHFLHDDLKTLRFSQKSGNLTHFPSAEQTEWHRVWGVLQRKIVLHLSLEHTPGLFLRIIKGKRYKLHFKYKLCEMA